jgi:hypothetical protein
MGNIILKIIKYNFFTNFLYTRGQFLSEIKSKPYNSEISKKNDFFLEIPELVRMTANNGGTIQPIPKYSIAE